MLWWLCKTAEGFYGAPRSGQWPRVRREHLALEPACVACGRTRSLEVHHIVPFSDRPELELAKENLVTLCADPCHLVHGHLMSWHRSNPDVREDCARYAEKVRSS
jgi:5-methylcytosine-specific restriction endonuclease McrA